MLYTVRREDQSVGSIVFESAGRNRSDECGVQRVERSGRYYY